MGLEAEFGMKLLHRNGRGVTLTQAGADLLAGSEHLLAEAERLDHRIRAFGTSVAGSAVIGLSPTIGRSLALPLIEKVRAGHPGIQLGIVEAFSGTLLEWLRSARVDAAILYHPPSLPGIYAEQVADEPLSILCGAQASMLPSGGTLDFGDLARLPLVLPTLRHGLRRMIDGYAQRAGIRLDPLFEIDSLEAMISIARKGLALTVLPEAAVRDELDSGRLVGCRIGSPPLSRPLLVATAAQRKGAVDARLTARLLKETILSAARASGWNSGPADTSANVGGE